MKKQFLILGVILLNTISLGMIDVSLASGVNSGSSTQSTGEEYTEFRDIDKGTYNEYRYYMVREYFKLKEYYDLHGGVNSTIANNILKHAETGFNYLPNTLNNQSYLNELSTAIKRGISSPNSPVNYSEIVKKLQQYIEEVNIQGISGSISATPLTGNAPLTSSLRADITDPTGANIPSSNYIWWMSQGGRKVVIGRGPSVNFTFKEQSNYTVFLDVKSSHKNSAGYTDVLPFQGRLTIQVKEKIASVIVRVNSQTLGNNDALKFTPDESNYGLIFDATNSVPTGGARFVRTEWDFGNGVVRRYDGPPKIERIIYSQEGTFQASLKLSTNEGQSIERKFTIFIHKPIASIVADKTEGYIGERFNFSTISSVNQRNLIFTWNVIDIGNDRVIKQHTGNVFQHSFGEKGRYNIQLRVKDAAGNEDLDSAIIHINSRAPVADFAHSVPNTGKPNRVLLDGTKSYDLDVSDAGKLVYRWTINGNLVTLDNIDSSGAIGYYTFDSIGEQDVSLEVIDPDNMSSVKTQRIRIDSILGVDFATFPRVIQRGGFIKFIADSENARIFEWDFGDGGRDAGASGRVDHIYDKSGIYNVKLTVRDADGKTNETTKVVYVGEADAPYAMIDVDYGSTERPQFQSTACNTGAYVVDRTKTITFRGGESLDVNGQTTGLTYSWKIGYDRYVAGRDTTYRFTELGCFPIKLTVRSDKNGATHTIDTFVRVENLKPTLSSLGISVQNENADPVVVNVVANGAQDPDGVIQSYLWYYYTDTDPDPQDFRSTIVSNTTFVIPKITGNYYFVVVMRDNNDERFSSEDLSDSKYFITLSGDNINTPLVDFRVNKSSVMAGESVVFSASAKNVLSQDITSKAEYAWDFNGDGFYDVETQVPTVEHTYETSGTFYAKVRVKYKGMTNVRTIEMNVSNVLEPDFEYTSIGDTFIFYNTSRGKVDSVVWDMGDGNIIYDRNYFTYTYEDGKPTHQVEIKITEGTKVRNKTVTVVKNMRNLLQSRNAEGIVIHSYPEIEDETIVLKTSNQKVYLYLGESKGDFTYYGVDFDINIDSDLNGGKDDDIDNKNDPSYEEGTPLEVILNDSREQIVRVLLLRANGSVVDSKDITLIKEYITESQIDVNTIMFEGVTDGERAKIEQVKTHIQNLPQQYRLKGMQYIQKLQENWFYPTEKTKIILEFEGFIDSTGVSNALEINTILESLLVEGQEDQSVRNMAYNVVKNLIPKELVEYESIIENLDIIAANPSNIEENKVFGKEILEMIKETSLITNDDKLTIKNQLQVFIYGSVENIPMDIREEVKQEQASSTGGNKIVGLFSGIVNILGVLVGGIVLIVIGFFIWFKISNKNANQGLQDFIIEKTNFDKTQDDILAKIPEVKPMVADKKEEKIKDPLGGLQKLPRDPLSMVREENKGIPKIEEKVNTSSPKTEEKVPDWLAGAIGKVSQNPEETKTEEKTEAKKLPEESKEQQGKSAFGEEKFGIEENKKDGKGDEEIETKIDEEKVPDWLMQGVKPSQTPEEKVNTPSPKTEEKLPTQASVKDTQEQTQQDTGMLKKDQDTSLGDSPKNNDIDEGKTEEKVPEWLAGAFDINNVVEETQPISEEKKEEEDLIISPETKDEEPKKAMSGEEVSPKKKVVKKTPLKNEEPKKDKKEEVTKQENIQTTSDKKNISSSSQVKEEVSGIDSSKKGDKKDELWNDGMDIPNWLQPEKKSSPPASKSKEKDIWSFDSLNTIEDDTEDQKPK